MGLTEYISASDEVGYGSWAGSLVVGIVCAPSTWTPPKRLTDSKKLSWIDLERLADGFDWSDPTLFAKVYSYSSEEIDRIGVGKLLRWAHEQAHDDARDWCSVKGVQSTHIADGNMKLQGVTSLVKADLKVPACSMAAVLAKVHHDREMAEFAKTYPGYDFENCVGYRSPKHIKGLETLGPCPIHRKSYSSYDQYKKIDCEPNDMWESIG